MYLFFLVSESVGWFIAGHTVGAIGSHVDSLASSVNGSISGIALIYISA